MHFWTVGNFSEEGTIFREEQYRQKHYVSLYYVKYQRTGNHTCLRYQNIRCAHEKENLGMCGNRILTY